MPEPAFPEQTPDASPPPDPAELASSVTNLLDSRPQAVVTLFQAFIRAAGPRTAGRRLFSAETVRLVVAYDQRRSDQSHTRQLTLVLAAVLALLIVSTALLVLVYLVRDRIELVRAVLAGVALLVSHGACSVGGYAVGRGRSRRRDR